jgi:hypothetical protein
MGRIGFRFSQTLAGAEDGYFHIDTVKDSASFAERVRVDADGNMGIGIIPNSKLDVSGQITIRASNPVSGKVLTCFDSNGLAVWQDMSGGQPYWKWDYQ